MPLSGPSGSSATRTDDFRVTSPTMPKTRFKSSLLLSAGRTHEIHLDWQETIFLSHWEL